MLVQDRNDLLFREPLALQHLVSLNARLQFTLDQLNGATSRSVLGGSRLGDVGSHVWPRGLSREVAPYKCHEVGKVTGGE